MSSSEQVLAVGRGFRIAKTDQQLIFEREHSATAQMVAFIAGTVSFVAIFVALALAGEAMADKQARASLLPVAAVLLFVASLAFFIALRAARRARVQRKRIATRIVLDETALRNETGEELAPRSSLYIRTGIDFTDGMGGFRFARVMSLCWPGQRTLVFKSYDADEMKRLERELAVCGIVHADKSPHKP